MGYDVWLSKRIYYVCLILSGIAFSGVIVLYVMHLSILDLNPTPCAFHELCEMYCPGCGGTRAVDALLHGHLLQSIYYHPVVPYVVVWMGCYLCSHTLSVCTGGRIRAMLFRPIYLYVCMGLLLLQWFGKNLVLLVFDYPIL